MKIERKFLHSKLARRIFWLFVVCALLPITVFAVVSFRNVTNQLAEQGRSQLHQASREEGMSIVERLNFLDTNLRLIAADIRNKPDADRSELAAGLNPQLKGRFEGLALVTSGGDEQLLFGKLQAKAYPDTNEMEHLRSGKSVLSTRPCQLPAPCIFLSRSVDSKHPGKEFLLAEVRGDYLWDKENIPEAVNVCIENDTGTTLFCSKGAPMEAPALPENRTSGQLEWKQGSEDYLADYWRLFLKPGYHTARWTVVASEAKSDILGPLSIFKRNFALAFLLALWVVLLLSLMQIRRNLVPLAELQQGTRRIAGGDFQSPMTVRSGDEFEELASSFNSMAARIEKQIGSMKTMNEIDRAILSAWEIEQIVDALIDRLPTLVSYELVSISLLDPQNAEHALTHVSAADPSGSRAVTTTTFTDDELKSLNAQKEIQTVGYEWNCPHHLMPLASRGMTSFLVAPIFLKGRVSAIIALGHSKGIIWTEADKQQMRQVADQMAVAIANARLMSELRQLHLGTLTALARAIDAKSPWTAGHSERVTKLAMRIAAASGLPKEELEIIHRGGLLHDIGKIGTPGYVLDKPGKLTQGEIEQMREHVSIGARILEPVPGFAECMPIVWQHHEWVDGSGYPKGLAGDEISLHARIFAVADCYDALTSDRPYRPGMSAEQAMRIIKEGAGTQFDPAVVETFLMLVKEKTEELQPSGVLVEAR